VPRDPYDIGRLRRFRSALDRLDPAGPPRAEVVAGSGPPPGAPAVGILAGSFNPPTVAHVDLAEIARPAARLDRVAFLLSKRTLDKERITGLALEDRLLLLSWLVEPRPWAAVALTNRGLYVDQAVAMAEALPAGTVLWFLVGSDKVLQIFDPRYYPDREAALAALFERAGLLAAGRGAAGAAEIDALLDRPENRPYRDRVRLVELPAAMSAISSTEVRQACARGEDIGTLVPREVATFLAETGAFAGEHATTATGAAPRYAARRRALGHLLAHPDQAADGEVFRRLVEEAPAGT
jgi:nicotinic acid mononucleotide adenylyltransferase